MQALLGAVPHSRGAVRVFGEPVHARVGRPGGPSPSDLQAVFQSVDAHIDPVWTPAALLAETAARFGRSSADAQASLERVGLAHRADVPAGRLSGGERRRLGLARVTVRPRVLGDEPQPEWMYDDSTSPLYENACSLAVDCCWSRTTCIWYAIPATGS